MHVWDVTVAQASSMIRSGELSPVTLMESLLERVRRLEPSLRDARPGTPYQFERLGYLCVDAVDSSPGALVFNRTVPLRDTWAKIDKRRV